MFSALSPRRLAAASLCRPKSRKTRCLSPQRHRLSDLRPIIPALLKALPLVKKGEVREIGA